MYVQITHTITRSRIGTASATQTICLWKYVSYVLVRHLDFLCVISWCAISWAMCIIPQRLIFKNFQQPGPIDYQVWYCVLVHIQPAAVLVLLFVVWIVNSVFFLDGMSASRLKTHRHDDMPSLLYYTAPRLLLVVNSGTHCCTHGTNLDGNIIHLSYLMWTWNGDYISGRSGTESSKRVPSLD